MALVLGGGWAGVVAALELKRNFRSADVLVIEKGPLGGLLRSENIRGYTFDIGGSHIIFSRNRGILDKMLDLLKSYLVHNRKAYIMIDKYEIPFPLENGLYVLPPEERAEAVVSFLESMMSLGKDWRPKNFAEWVRAFGSWISKKYLEPYNLKIWKRPLEELDVDWVYTPGRVPLPDWRDVVKAAAGVSTTGYVEQSVFYYPERGGIYSQYESALREAERLGVKIVREEVKEVKREGGTWVVNGRWRGKMLINTIPLPTLVDVMDAPEDVLKAASSLDYNKVVVVGIGVRREAPPKHWVYVPGDSVFHRFAWISNYSPYNAPRGHASVIAEITIPRGGDVDLEKIKLQTVQDFEKLGVIDSRDVEVVDVWLHEFGYPIHCIECNKKRGYVLEWLNQQGVYTVGRWGSWRYWNTDKVYEAVIDLVNQLVSER